MGIAAGAPRRPRRRAAVSDVLVAALTPAVADETLDIVLRHLVEGVPTIIEGAAGAGVVAALDDHEMCRASTDGAVRRLLEAELEAGEGPSLRAMAERRIVEADLAELCRRWPLLAAEAEAAGVGGVLAIPLGTANVTLGAFTVLHGGAPLDSHARGLAETLARAALLAVERNHHEQHTRRALESRSLIGSAIGILMERYDLSASAAWEHLRRRASDEERKLRDVAHDIVTDRGSRSDPQDRA